MSPDHYPPDDPREWLNRARSNLVQARARQPGVYSGGPLLPGATGGREGPQVAPATPPGNLSLRPRPGAAPRPAGEGRRRGSGPGTRERPTQPIRGGGPLSRRRRASRARGVRGGPEACRGRGALGGGNPLGRARTIQREAGNQNGERRAMIRLTHELPDLLELR